MPTNTILDVSFSDTEVVNNVPAGLLSLVYTATGGETSFQKDELVSATIVNLSRDGSIYTPVTTFSDATKKEFKFYPEDDTEDAGTVVFHTGLPAMEAGEDSVMNYISGGSTTPTSEPITINDVKKWCNIELDFTYYDALLTALITAARQYCEAYVGHSLIPRTITATLRNDLGNVRLPFGPAGNVLHVYGSDGTTEITTDNYTITGTSIKRIKYPVTDDCNETITVEYEAGYTTLPDVFKTAIEMQVAYMFQNRGDEENKGVSSEVKMILGPHKVFTI
jgi:uncharacterized phiE125 gp8 family phage protein